MSGALATRLLKTQCGTCAYTARVTRRWLAESGPPICPLDREPMECAQFEDIEERARVEMEAHEAEALQVEHRTLREAWTRARIVHTCTRCKAEIPIGEEYHRHTYRAGGELVTDKQCIACKLRQTGESTGRGAIGRA